MQSLREGHGDATCKLNKSKVDGKIIIVSKARFPDPESRRVLVDDKVGNKSRSYDSGNNVRNEVRVQSVLDSSSPLGSSLWGITFSAEPRKRPEQSHAFSRENVSGYEHENVLTINNVALVNNTKYGVLRPFKYFNYLLEEDGFTELVISNIQHSIKGNRRVGVLKPLKNSKQAIKEWIVKQKALMFFITYDLQNCGQKPPPTAPESCKESFFGPSEECKESAEGV
ncbi:hypothetical protein V6N12_062490 [Hibiscus sabdariffa]|uniref:Uncharacterized protein n=1 Tax=Hibiscus sabdariffa TaxID=183260 RepID=A0ABR2F995_9ROSI